VCFCVGIPHKNTQNKQFQALVYFVIKDAATMTSPTKTDDDNGRSLLAAWAGKFLAKKPNCDGLAKKPNCDGNGNGKDLASTVDKSKENPNDDGLPPPLGFAQLSPPASPKKFSAPSLKETSALPPKVTCAFGNKCTNTQLDADKHCYNKPNCRNMMHHLCALSNGLTADDNELNVYCCMECKSKKEGPPLSTANSTADDDKSKEATATNNSTVPPVPPVPTANDGKSKEAGPPVPPVPPIPTASELDAAGSLLLSQKAATDNTDKDAAAALNRLSKLSFDEDMKDFIVDAGNLVEEKEDELKDEDEENENDASMEDNGLDNNKVQVADEASVKKDKKFSKKNPLEKAIAKAYEVAKKSGDMCRTRDINHPYYYDTIENPDNRDLSKDYCPVCKTYRIIKSDKSMHLMCCRVKNKDTNYKKMGCGLWFHPKCVGLSEVPDGDWVCQDCAEEFFDPKFRITITGMTFEPDTKKSAKKNTQSEDQVLQKKRYSTRK